jgi:predicted PurR-regulated permease PerM
MDKIDIKNFPPLYIKYFVILVSVTLTVYLLVLGQSVFKPLLAAFVIALQIKPLCYLMEKIKIYRLISTILALLFILTLLSALSIFFSLQIAEITADINSVIHSFDALFDQLQQWTSARFGITPSDQIIYLKNAITTLLKNSTAFYKNMLSTTAGFFSTMFLFLIALFFFLYYRSFFVSFLEQIVESKDHPRVKKTLNKIEHVVRQYTWGLFLVISIIAALNTTGLLILGVKHAIFFGCFAALLIIIPYIGITIGALLPTIYALATTDSLWYPAGVIILFLCIQFLEGNFITPNIVGTRVSINPFVVIVGMFISGMLFGIIGVIFIIPVLAIIKVISDEVNMLKPLGYLLGNPSSPKGHRK